MSMNSAKTVVLCVDDEQFNREIVKDLLSSEGYLVLEASDTREAQAILENNPVDIILLDIVMPGENGVEFCARLKSYDQYRNIPIILLTSLGSSEDRVKGIEAGAEDFITKPFIREEILARIRMLIRVKGLNEKLFYAYNTIKKLTAFGESFIQTFDAKDFDLLFSMDGIVNQLFRHEDSPFVKPSLIILGVKGEELTYYKYSSKNGKISRDLIRTEDLPIDPFSLCTDERSNYFLNGPEMADSEIFPFLDQLDRLSINVRNAVVHLSANICIFALNYLSEATPYDAAVLESLVMQANFLRSLSTQVTETEDAFTYTVYSLARASEANDMDTGNHILRVGEYCMQLVERLGMSDRFGRSIRLQGALHDIGKIHTPPEILKKPGALTKADWVEIKKHTLYGARIIGDHPRFTIGKNIALSHHEKWDGSGYPDGLSGTRIPIEGRITAIADTYDALRNERIYKPAVGHDETVKILLEGDDRTIPGHYDPEVLEAFRTSADRFGQIYEEMVG